MYIKFEVLTLEDKPDAKPLELYAWTDLKGKWDTGLDGGVFFYNEPFESKHPDEHFKEPCKEGKLEFFIARPAGTDLWWVMDENMNMRYSFYNKNTALEIAKQLQEAQE